MLHQTRKALDYVGGNGASSQETAKALRTIRHYALSIIGLAAVGEIFIMSSGSDDRAGGVFMGGLVIAGAVVIAAAATRFERVLQDKRKDRGSR